MSKLSGLLGPTMTEEDARKLKGIFSVVVGQPIQGLLSTARSVADMQSGRIAPYAVDPVTGEVHTNPEMIERMADVAGTVGGGAGLVPVRGSELGMGIRAFHGSPHDFDEFDFSKIGTGEGAQAYGHGGYFAEHEPVAREYRDRLSRQVTYQGKPLGTHASDDELETAKHSVASSVADGADPAVAIRQQASEWRQAAADYRRSAKKYPEASEDAIQTAENFERIAASIEALTPADFVKNPGRMYEVEIDAEPEQFLDWDANVANQPEPVQKALSELGIPTSSRPERNGWWAYRRAQQDVPPSGRGEIGHILPQDASERLRKAGIQGIRYKDAGSRGKDGEGSRNYVVFDDKLVKVLRKYGLPITAGGLATLTQMGLAPEPAQAKAK